MARGKAKARQFRLCLLLLKSLGFRLRAMNVGYNAREMDEVARRHKTKGGFVFLLLWSREPFGYWRIRANKEREWGSRGEESVLSRRKAPPPSWEGNGTIDILLGQPRIHFTPADCQARKGILGLFLSKTFPGPDRSIFFLKNHCQEVLKRILLKEHRLNLYCIQYLLTPSGWEGCQTQHSSTVPLYPPKHLHSGQACFS